MYIKNLLHRNYKKKLRKTITNVMDFQKDKKTTVP